MAEIAGIVLGGFPLIISALEHYRDGFEPLRDWWKFESEFGNFIEELGTQQTRFDMNLEKLLDPFVTSSAQMHAFLDQHNPQAWQDPAFEGDIRKRLGHSYEWYIAICRKMNDTLGNLEERLGIEDGQIGYRDASKWDHELRRLRISFSRKKFKHVKLLAKYNDELQQLLSSNDELGSSRKRRSKTSMISLVQSLQHHSQVLYSGLTNTWICKCTTPHKTRLLLERHGEANESALTLHLLLEAAGVSRPIEVRIDKYSSQENPGSFVPNSTNANLLQLRQQIHEREVRLAPASSPIPTNKTLVQSLQSMTITDTAAIGPSSSQPAQIPSARKSLFSSRSKKTARFAATATATATATPSIPSISTRLTADEIKDICSEISGWKSKAECIGFIPVAPQSRFLFYPARHKNLEQQYLTVTLEDLLPNHSREFNDSQKMTRKQRFTLANILAFTLLQLQPTPWLPSNWSKRDITFICPDSSDSPEISHPYVGKDFPAIPSTTPASKAECKQSLLHLGILLLELTFNERLETLPLRQKYLGPQGIPNEYTDLCTAKEWHSEVEGECGEGLSEVIRRCIDCSFGEKPDWNSEAFLEEYVGYVLEPLKELLQQWENSV